MKRHCLLLVHVRRAFCVAAALVPAVVGAAGAETEPLPDVPPGYFDEPKDLPFQEEVVVEKREDGCRWKEFYYTSLVYRRRPIRVHAVFAIPGWATAERQVPAILATHGKFGAIFGKDPRYWSAVRRFVKAGYAVLFYDWNPRKPDFKEACTHYGALDYFAPGEWMQKGNDWKDCLFYQQTMIGRRGINWLSRQPEVCAGKIGVWGCSYGGIFSSLVGGVDPRVAAVNSVVYTALFGKESPLYSSLPRQWTDDEVRAWRARFDSAVHLRRRSVPILYTVAANDTAFDARHAMATYAAMNQPKTLLMSSTEGHGFWAMEQTIRFFDHALKGEPPFPTIGIVQITRAGHHVVAAVTASGNGPLNVRLFFSPLVQIDQGTDTDKIPPKDWPWLDVPARAAASGHFSAEFDLPRIEPVAGGQRFYCWRCGRQIPPGATACPVDGQPQPGAGQGLLRAFARVTDARGAMACSPLSEAVAFSDSELGPASVASASNEALPSVDGVAPELSPGSSIRILPNVTAGTPMAELPYELPCKGVGRGGYVLFNWRKNPPLVSVKTEGVETPTKIIRPPFADTITEKTFRPSRDVIANALGGRQILSINAIPDLVDRQTKLYYHGAIPQKIGGDDQIASRVSDEREHRLTIIMTDSYGVPPWVRISLIVRLPTLSLMGRNES